MQLGIKDHNIKGGKIKELWARIFANVLSEWRTQATTTLGLCGSNCWHFDMTGPYSDQLGDVFIMEKSTPCP